MADITKITLPNGSSYNFKDATARAGLAGKAEASHTHNYLPLAGGEMNGPVKWNTDSLPEQANAAQYIVCIDAFKEGGTMKWKQSEKITVGDADTVDGKHASDFAAASHTHTKSQITDFPTIPTKTSQLTNDSGFLTEHQDLSEYAKIDDLFNAVTSIEASMPTKTSELTNDSGFLTEHQDLSEYVRTDDLNVALENKADISHTHDEYASKDLYSDTTINFGRKAGTYVGLNSTAEGASTTASGTRSHAEGGGTSATEANSHAEGYGTLASGTNSHAEGYNTTASMNNAHAEGSSTTASAVSSHSEGVSTTASNYASHASGKYNAAMTAGGSSSNTTGTAFVIGNGSSDSAKSNAFSVQYDGTVKAKSTITASTTADYAEFFEWLDENPDGEDRVGYFVTLDGDKIRIANSDDEYILGVVSGEPFVLGNGDCDTWNGMFLRDEFRRTIYEPAPKMEEILDDDGKPTGEYVEVEGEYEGTRPKLNPDYDHTKKYTSRFDRKEWAPIGMLGVLAVRHDGTAKVNGYVTVADGGIATACDKNTENSYRVIKANSDLVVEIIFR